MSLNGRCAVQEGDRDYRSGCQHLHELVEKVFIFVRLDDGDRNHETDHDSACRARSRACVRARYYLRALVKGTEGLVFRHMQDGKQRVFAQPSACRENTGNTGFKAQRPAPNRWCGWSDYVTNGLRRSLKRRMGSVGSMRIWDGLGETFWRAWGGVVVSAGSSRTWVLRALSTDHH